MSPQLRLHSAPSEQIQALRALKNEIIGHPLKKETTVALGALDTIVRLSTNKTASRNDGKSHNYTFASRPLSEDEIVRLLSLQVIASIAIGGPSFLVPLQSASAVPAVLSNLCPSSNPSQLVLASLRALLNLAESFALAGNTHVLATNTLAEAIFVRLHLNSLCRILSQTSGSTTVQCQILIAASLISRVCREERHQQGLANSGVLDALATRLASFVVAEGLVIPGAEVLAERDGIQEYIPPPAPPNASLSVILEAISVIIANSKFRASQLLYSPSILAIFPTALSTEFVANRGTRAAWNAFNAAGLSARQSQLNAVDFLLPCMPLHQPKISAAQASAFPPLGTPSSRENLAHNGRKNNGASTTDWSDSFGLDTSTPSHKNASSDFEDPESPLIAYLIWLLRSRFGMERLMAASVLAILYRAGLTHKSRETAVGLLVVPLLVNMLDDIVIPSKSKDSLSEAEATSLDQAMKEEAPATLAMLITDSEYLQKAALDANIISKLSKMLKTSYDPIPEAYRSHQWSPRMEGNSGNRETSRSSRLGYHGQSPLLYHKIKVRESTLKAIAALVPFKDEYRKAIVDQGMIPYIVESLSSTPGKPTPKAGEKPDKSSRPKEENGKQQYGINPTEVLIAACGAIRALARSVSILRTTLIDNGVAMPVFVLLSHPDIEVQIAATAAVCNLVVDVSPMREMVSEAGVLKILCEHAHSMNAQLRLNALWALKHFVHDVSNDMKRLCLEELGQGWLVQLICDDTEDEALVNSRGADSKMMAPDISEDIDQDVEMDQFEDCGISTLGGGSFGRSTSRPHSSRSRSVQQAEMRLAALRDAETNPARKARKDDIAVQEQGLDFIRNFISGAGQGGTNETTEMIDFLLNALGQDRVFEILASKLRPKLINPFSRRGPSSTEMKVIPPQSEIITAVVYILIHMAGSIPRHRQLVIAQTDVLKLLVQQLGHPSAEVRVVLCHLLINLTWRDDTNDSQACAQRANELKKLGFLSKLEMLEQDPELNVRQQAKTALWQMKQGYQ